MKEHSSIRDLGLIGDQRTAAVIDREAAIVWYCPGRFDRSSLFAHLLDPRGGTWRLNAPGLTPAGRGYIGDSSILVTRLSVDGRIWTVTDFLAVGVGVPAGVLCRIFSPPPAGSRMIVVPKPDYGYGNGLPRLEIVAGGVAIDRGPHFRASHPITLEGTAFAVNLPRGEGGWALLSDQDIGPVTRADVDAWLAATLLHWDGLAEQTSYSGPYERAVRDSLRALRLLTHARIGGIVAAATTSLPEVPGDERNYDYRYVWMRDSGMIVSALTRAGSRGEQERRFLDFLCSVARTAEGAVLPPFVTLDGAPPPPERDLPLTGFLDSRPVRVGNGARRQHQLDAFGNVLLAAKLIYGRFSTREHWSTMAALADHVAAHWAEPDHGLWEESVKRHYTVCKVIAACALDFIAEFADDGEQARVWRAAARDIREFVSERCLRPDGAYAAFAGSTDVDISAALFPVWTYTDPTAPEMLATIAAIEKDLAVDGLYRRHLECTDARREGGFLAGSFWMAQYWIMRGDLDRARRIADRALDYSNDLGLMAEEAEPGTDRMLGNFPQSFVHAALIGVAIDLKAAMKG